MIELKAFLVYRCDSCGTHSAPVAPGELVGNGRWSEYEATRETKESGHKAPDKIHFCPRCTADANLFRA